VKNTIRKIAKRLGLHLVSDYDFHRQKLYVNLLEQFITNNAENKVTEAEGSCIVIFSKDRAMQLDALLRSYFSYVENRVEVKVLYNASTASYHRGYEKLISMYAKRGVGFFEEKSFKKDLLTLFDKEIHSEKVFFLVDDLFFKREIDLSEFTAINPKNYVASLRLGEHLNYSYTLQKEQELPTFEKSKAYPGFLSWSWEGAYYDWAYPLSVDGHLFDVEEMRILLRELDYKAPNSLEAALQLMNPLFSKRKGLCFPRSVIVNNPCNKVQSENANVHGAVSIEELNERWLQGERIQFEAYHELANESAHQDLPLKFIRDEG
jgi:hypothetical protein